MPTLHMPPSLDLHYLVDDYTDPWRTPGTILLLHGNAESSAAWYAWVPRLAHRYRVVRPDMRGFGASTPMPREFPWTLDLVPGLRSTCSSASISSARVGAATGAVCSSHSPVSSRCNCLCSVRPIPPSNPEMSACACVVSSGGRRRRMAGSVQNRRRHEPSVGMGPVQRCRNVAVLRNNSTLMTLDTMSPCIDHNRLFVRILSMLEEARGRQLLRVSHDHGLYTPCPSSHRLPYWDLRGLVEDDEIE